MPNMRVLKYGGVLLSDFRYQRHLGVASQTELTDIGLRGNSAVHYAMYQYVKTLYTSIYPYGSTKLKTA